MCAGGAALAMANWDQMVMAGEFESFPPAKLTKKDGAPLKASQSTTREAMVFAYPLAGVPCFLINLGEHSGETGVGPKNQYVAYVAICTHQLSYPQPEVSYLRFATEGSELAGGPNRIVCCAHASVFDPAEGAKVISGPAGMPLLPVRLSYDAATDELSATGIMGMDFVRTFFNTYKGDLNARYGRGAYREAVGASTATLPLSEYSGVVPAC